MHFSSKLEGRRPLSLKVGGATAPAAPPVPEPMPWGPKKHYVCEKHQFWKLKERRVVYHVFQHAEFDGARKSLCQASFDS